MRRILVIIMTILMLSVITACGSKQPNKESEPTKESATEAPETTIQKSPEVDSIDFSTENGRVKYTHFQKAKAKLTDEDNDNALVFVFEFTNFLQKPSAVHSFFRFKFFQNGTELNDSRSCSSEGGYQYELVSAFFDEAMKDGTVIFGIIVIPKDESPVTVMVEPNGGSSSDDYQMMEVKIGGELTEDFEGSTVTADVIDAALQGDWASGQGITSFADGAFEIKAVEIKNESVRGDYEIDTSESSIKCYYLASDGKMKITLPYTYVDGVLTLYNSRGEAFVKQ